MLDKRYSKTKIAELLGVDRSTIYREIKRNRLSRILDKRIYYIGSFAHQRYIKRRKKKLRLLQEKELRHYVHEKLRLGWSPWQIEGHLKREHEGKCVISHETIYRYIYSDDVRRNCFSKKLRRRHFHRLKLHKRNPKFPKALSIHHRPKEINERQTFGHWECDLMIFQRGIHANLITLRERKTRFIIAIKNANKTAQGTALNLISTVKNLKKYIKSMTFDQGSEFHKYPWIRDCLESEIYFCDPGCPYQKGAVENGNGVIRCEFPRDYDLSACPQREINRRLKEINGRPMKCLGYQTPQEVFNAYCARELSGEITSDEKRI
jgi:IS30 family transposase